MEGILRPILFWLTQNPAQGIRSARQLGTPRLLPGGIPPPTQPALYISGITRTSTGVALASCQVQLFRTIDDMFLEEVTSDGSGAYAFSPVGLGQYYYIVAYKANAPDVSGTTVNTLQGV